MVEDGGEGLVGVVLSALEGFPDAPALQVRHTANTMQHVAAACDPQSVTRACDERMTGLIIKHTDGLAVTTPGS
jgi:hypothetical protein